jgi:glycosyltransferase involved in cell wall biosynthesis
LATLTERLEVARDERLLVEYVPHAFGSKGMNLPLCVWLLGQRRSPIVTIFHEVGCGFSLSQPVKYNLQAAVHRAMATIVVRSSRRVIVTIPRWRDLLRPLAARGCSIEVFPAFSNFSVVEEPGAIRAVRQRALPKGGLLIGHFGSYGANVTPMLDASMARLLENNSTVAILLLGRGGDDFRNVLTKRHPHLCERVTATGTLPPDMLSVHLSACDLMLQPYPDGISGRRSSALVGLQHGRAMVSTIGELSEPYWNDTDALLAVRAGDTEAFSVCAESALRDPELRMTLGAAAARIYKERFSPEPTVMALRSDAAEPASCDAALAGSFDGRQHNAANGGPALRSQS